MRPFLSPPLFTLPLMSDPLVVWKSFKKERRHAERTWRYNCQAFLVAFLPPVPDVWLSACSIVCLCLLLVCVPGDPLVQKYSSFVICLRCLLSCHSSHLRTSISVQFVPLSLPQRPNHLYIFFFLLLPLSYPHFHYPHHSYWLFTRSVNNCLPTVVIASPCQPELWSKWQCARLSLAYTLKSPVSPVPPARKERTKIFLSSDVFVFEGFVSEPINLFAFQSDSFYFSSAVGKFIFSGRLCWTGMV